MDTRRRSPEEHQPDDEGAETLGICRDCVHAFVYSARFERFPYGPPDAPGESWKESGDRERKYVVLCRHPMMLVPSEGGDRPRQLEDPVTSCDGFRRRP
jgi:hypothetical protein